MFVKLLATAMVLSAVIALDLSRFKGRKKHELAIYGILVAAAIYLGLDYAFDKDWPDLNDATNFVFSYPIQWATQLFEQ